ncbi:MAG TPA: hypothetical protein VFQ92_05750 [Blastocatellia bacterium]|nr:hypothetical protein [Blastocatellia bacterium]
MTWSEIKKAVEQAGIKEEDDICTIHCAIHHGNKSLHPIRIGRFVRLAEDFSDGAAESEFSPVQGSA